MRVTYLPILLPIHICEYLATSACQQKFLKQLDGIHCVVFSGSSIQQDIRIPDIQRQRCNYECMRRASCSAAHYNASENACYVNEDKCHLLLSKPDFETIYFGNLMTTTDCLSWVTETDFDSDKTLTLPRCYVEDPDNAPCHLGRLLSTGNILPGSFVPAPIDELLSVLNGAKHTEGSRQVLQVHPKCDELWAFFNPATDTLPHGVVKAGYLASTESDLYAIRGQLSGGLVFGYFNPDSSRGYYIDSGSVKEVALMNILVIL